MVSNPFKESEETQYLMWKHLTDKTEYKMELIQPMKAMLSEYADGGYLNVAAEVLEDKEPDLHKGTFIMISFPTQALKTAWMAKSWTFRKQFKEDDNLKVSLRKDTRKSMAIFDLEKLTPTERQLDFAKRIYAADTQYTTPA